MFNTPIEDIDFATIKSFCDLKLKERLDLDYKSDFPSDLAKILCGMANVQGGMVLIGIEEDKNTREPIWPPVGVEGTEDELRQRVIQIAYDAIYPPVIPEVTVCPMPDQNRSVVVIRVDASNLLHAVDGRKKIYVRVADHSRVHPYELADLSQLEWLWHRRSKSVEFREYLISRAQERASRLEDVGQPLLEITLTPLYPDQLSGVSPGDLLAKAKNLPPASLVYHRVRMSLVPEVESGWRTVAGGVCIWSFQRSPGQYLELGSHGLSYLAQLLETQDYYQEYAGEGEPKQGILAIHILDIYEASLIYATNYFGSLQWPGPVLMIAKLQNIKNIVLSNQLHGQRIPHRESYNHDCPDDEIELATWEYRASTLVDEHEKHLKDFATALFWAFGYGFTHDGIQEWLDNLKGLH